MTRTVPCRFAILVATSWLVYLVDQFVKGWRVKKEKRYEHISCDDGKPLQCACLLFSPWSNLFFCLSLWNIYFPIYSGSERPEFRPSLFQSLIAINTLARSILFVRPRLCAAQTLLHEYWLSNQRLSFLFPSRHNQPWNGVSTNVCGNRITRCTPICWRSFPPFTRFFGCCCPLWWWWCFCFVFRGRERRKIDEDLVLFMSKSVTRTTTDSRKTDWAVELVVHTSVMSPATTRKKGECNSFDMTDREM